MIPENETSTALHGDRVLVRRNVRPRGLRPDRGATQETGSVIRIFERKRSQIVGTLQRGRQFLYVIPDDPRMPHDIYVPEPRDVGRKPNLGDKVVVELIEWTSRHNNPEGEIIEVLGAPDAEGVDMLSVLRQYNLPLHFPKPVLAEARAIGSTVSAHEVSLDAKIVAGIRSSPLIPMTRRISTTRSVCNALATISGNSGFTSPTCHIT
jgi:ribonuclease R